MCAWSWNHYAGSPHQLVVFQFLGVNAVRRKDAAIVLHHPDALGTSSMQIAAGVKTHITKTLQENTHNIEVVCRNHKPGQQNSEPRLEDKITYLCQYGRFLKVSLFVPER